MHICALFSIKTFATKTARALEEMVDAGFFGSHDMTVVNTGILGTAVIGHVGKG